MAGLPSKGDGQGVMLIALSAIFLALALIAVALRLWSRRLMRAQLALNDYLVLLAMVYRLLEFVIMPLKDF